MQNKNTENLLAFRDIVNVLIDNSLLLSFEEKTNFKQLTPMLDMGELMELFRLLVRSKDNVDNILENLTKQYPQVVNQFSSYQKNALKNIFKYERDSLKTKLN